jgi:hypothetical protein
VVQVSGRRSPGVAGVTAIPGCSRSACRRLCKNINKTLNKLMKNYIENYGFGLGPGIFDNYEYSINLMDERGRMAVRQVCCNGTTATGE